MQTPTLAMVVERELAIRTFRARRLPGSGGHVPSERQAGGEHVSRGRGFATRSLTASRCGCAADGKEAEADCRTRADGTAAIESIESETQRMPPPALYDLTELQRHANRLFGFSAQKTLDIAQALYERHKLISYPRTDSRHLSQDVAATLPRIVKVIAGPYREQLAPGRASGRWAAASSTIRRSRDHHAIIPTTVSPEKADLSPDERKIYDLICRRLLSAWHDDHIWSVTTVITAITNAGHRRPLSHVGNGGAAGGLEGAGHRSSAKNEEGQGGGEDAATQNSAAARISSRARRRTCSMSKRSKKKTRPPKRFTEATLLTAMETAGKTLDEKELSDAMKETGLGTPATRAAIIEVLLKREYIVRNGKSLEATDKGIRLIEVVHPEVKSPAMTGQWEAYLKRIQRGEAQLSPFLEGHRGLCARGGGQSGDRAPPQSSWRRAARPAAPMPPLRTTQRCRRIRVARRICCTRRSASRRSGPIRKRSARR